MTPLKHSSYVSRGGGKLAAALDHFHVDVVGCVCADLGSHVGGFVECLLDRGAARVYAVDTAYGILAWKLRRDPRVSVFERTNAMHVVLPESVELVTIDVGWTPQARILPHVVGLLGHARPVGRALPDGPSFSPPRPGRARSTRLLGRAAEQSPPACGQSSAPPTRPTARVVTLIKPHYEAGAHLLADGVLPEEQVDPVVARVLREVSLSGWTVVDTVPSPIRGHGGNREVFALLRPTSARPYKQTILRDHKR